MLIFAIIAVIAAFLCLTALILYRRHIRQICRQFQFLKQHETNLHLSSELPFPELSELTDDINALLDEHRKTVLAVRQSENELRETIANLSHDIRTPLTSMNGYFQLLTQSDNAGDAERYAFIIQNRIKALRDILEQLFNYAKLQDKEYELPIEQVDLSLCVYTNIFSFYDEFRGNGIDPDIRICDETILVNGNQEALDRILQNIIKNAFEHSRTLITLELFQDGGDAVFRCRNDVEDPENINMELLFQRFYRADPSRPHSSTGLGLPIARGLAERMHGSIDASLEESIFTIEFRLKVSEKEPVLL